MSEYRGHSIRTEPSDTVLDVIGLKDRQKEREVKAPNLEAVFLELIGHALRD
ncbi:MAG: hypothetical protein ACYDBJ_08130 [Aggregatilineales bacterium]